MNSLHVLSENKRVNRNCFSHGGNRRLIFHEIDGNWVIWYKWTRSKCKFLSLDNRESVRDMFPHSLSWIMLLVIVCTEETLFLLKLPSNKSMRSLLLKYLCSAVMQKEKLSTSITQQFCFPCCEHLCINLIFKVFLLWNEKKKRKNWKPGWRISIGKRVDLSVLSAGI